MNEAANKTSLVALLGSAPLSHFKNMIREPFPNFGSKHGGHPGKHFLPIFVRMIQYHYSLAVLCFCTP